MTRSADPATAKAELRARVRAGRQAMSEEQIESSRTGVRAHVLARMDAEAEAGRPWRRIFAYLPRPDEPGSVQLLESMADRGASIFVPWLRPDRDLDWTGWPDATTSGRGALVDASVVLVPAFAVDRSGVRLGRGGGSYDRVLSRLSADTPVIALLHAGELLTFVPCQPWDRPVSAVVTATGWSDVRPPTGPTPV